MIAAFVALSISFWEHFFGSSVSAWFLVFLSACLLWMGAYKAWEKKRDELIAERQKNMLPELKGTIKEAFIGPPLWLSETVNLDKRASIVVLRLELWNAVKMDRVGVKEYRLIIRVNGSAYEGLKESPCPLNNLELRGEFPDQSIQRLDLAAGIGDVWYLVPTRGVTAFVVKGLRNLSLSGKANLELRLTDYADRVHVVKADGIRMKGDRVCYS